MATEGTLRIEAAIAAVPRGRVMSYGAIAAAAGMPGAARQVVRILHSRSEKDGLPWFRIVRSNGTIALPEGGGFELQKALLEAEGVEVRAGGKIDLVRFGWTPGSGKSARNRR